MNRPHNKPIEIATLQRTVKCVRCDTEVLVYVPIEQADLLAAVTPAYCAQCVTWGLIEKIFPLAETAPIH